MENADNVMFWVAQHNSVNGQNGKYLLMFAIYWLDTPGSVSIEYLYCLGNNC
jgi:hypothetical protein